MEAAESEPAPPRRRRRRGALILAGVVLAGAGTGAAVIATRNSRPAPDAHAVALNAVRALSQHKTAHVDIHLSTDSADGEVSVIGGGSVDFDSQALRLQVSVSDPQGAMQMPVIYTRGTLYEAVPGLDTIEPGKTWVSIDSGTRQGGHPSALGVAGNPAVLLDLFVRPGATVIPAGVSELNGTELHGYYVTFSPQSLQALRADTRLPADERDAVSQDVTDMSGNLQLDHAGHLVEDTLSLTVAGSDPMLLTESVDFSHFGAGVAVAAPPPGQVVGYQKVLQDEQGSSVQVV